MSHLTTKMAGVMGWPVGHSKSPKLHGFWLDRHQIDGVYLPLPVAPENIEAAVKGLPALGFAGANVTIPHKESVMPFCDRLTATAERIGAVNTLVIGDDGLITGDNTDGFGFIENLRFGASDLDLTKGPSLVLGAGGASRGIAVALLDAGAPEVLIFNRTVSRAEAIAADISDQRVKAAGWDRVSSHLSGATLLVNATSLGMVGQPALEVDLAPLPSHAVVTDIVYAPLVTPLLHQARNLGLDAVDGLGMLLHQARPGFEAWFGVAPTVDEALRAHVLA